MSLRRRVGNSQGFTLIELLIVVALIGIIAAMGAPFLIAAKASANEASAIGTARALHSAESTFSTSCGHGAYSTSLAGLVSGEFASPDMDITPKSGFEFVLAAGNGAAAGPMGCDGLPTRTGYYFSAEPIADNTGGRAFATNQNGVIWQDSTGAAAPTEPFAATATVAPLER